MDGWVKLSGARVKRPGARARSIRGRALQGGTDDGFDAPDVQQLEGERPGAGRIDPFGAVALGEPQEFLRLPQTSHGNVPRSNTVMNWPPAGWRGL
jgi:hypothetical protein